MVRSSQPKRKRRSAQDSREQIIACAKVRFASAGFEGTTTRKIADDMGVAQSLLLYHFATKLDLWQAVMTQIFARAIAIIEQEQAKADRDDPASQLRASIKAFIQICIEEPDLHRLITLEGRAHSDRLVWLADAYLKPMHDRSVELIKRCQNQGAVKKGDPTHVHYTILGVAGTLLSYTPEMSLLSPASVPPDPRDVERHVCTAVFASAESAQ